MIRHVNSPSDKCCLGNVVAHLSAGLMCNCCSCIRFVPYIFSHS